VRRAWIRKVGSLRKKKFKDWTAPNAEKRDTIGRAFGVEAAGV
jgi:hypothetical protein